MPPVGTELPGYLMIKLKHGLIGKIMNCLKALEKEEYDISIQVQLT
jgi:hypothetical protein